MGRIDQIYCTHCTPETSVFGRFAGYSARAGSLDPEALRAAYDRVFRTLTTYQLPADMPLDAVVRATASSAPVRLIFQPGAGDFQAVGQVCYRPAEATGPGGVGNYFGHFVFTRPEPGSEGWTALDALRLWGAKGWVRADSGDLPQVLPTLDRLDALLDGGWPSIDEDVFLGFLTTPPPGPFLDPGGIIPERWRTAPCRARQDLFEEMLSGFLGADPGRRGALVLVAEPGLAALLFFGLIRAVPASLFGRAIGFSTYEAGTPLTTLAATLPHDPTRARLPGAGCVIDTFAAARRSDRGPPRGGYATRVRRTLVEGGGWETLDRMIAGFMEAGARRPRDLDDLAEADAAIGDLFDPSAASPVPRRTAGGLADRYLATAARGRVRAVAGQPETLRAIAGSPHAPALLGLLTQGDPDAELAPAIEAILAGLSPDGLAAFLRSPEIPRRHRVLALLGHVSRHGRWPEPIEAAVYLQVAGKPSGLAPATVEIVPDVLDRLRPEWLKSLGEFAPPPVKSAFLLSVAVRLAAHPAARPAVREIVAEMGDDDFAALVQTGGTAIASLYGDDPSALQSRAGAMLRGLAHRPRQFEACLAALKTLGPRLRTDQAATVRAWESILATIRRAAEPRGRARGVSALFRKGGPPSPTPADFADLARALREALPEVVDPAHRSDLLLRLIDKGLHPRGDFPADAREAIGRAILGRGSS